MPDERVQGYYVQPLEVLDLAWDRLHREDVSDSRTTTAAEPSPFKSVVAILAGRVDPVDISHVIDVAITAWRWREVPSGVWVCSYCGDQTEIEEDPDPLMCAMCVKLPGRATISGASLPDANTSMSARVGAGGGHEPYCTDHDHRDGEYSLCEQAGEAPGGDDANHGMSAEPGEEENPA